jgi:hypothetical protein
MSPSAAELTSLLLPLGIFLFLGLIALSAWKSWAHGGVLALFLSLILLSLGEKESVAKGLAAAFPLNLFLTLMGVCLFVAFCKQTLLFEKVLHRLLRRKRVGAGNSASAGKDSCPRRAFFTHK